LRSGEEDALLPPFLSLGRECPVAPTFGLLGALKFPRMEAVGAAFGATAAAAAADHPPELPGVCATPRVAVWSVTTGARHAWIFILFIKTYCTVVRLIEFGNIIITAS